MGMPQQVAAGAQPLPHQRHLDKGVACGACHAADPHADSRISQQECSACHHQLKEGTCAACHQAQAALYTGRAPAWGAQGEPDPMAEEEVACRECHDPARPLSLEAVGRACVGCHEGGYEEDLAQWRAQVAAALQKVEPLVAQARTRGSAGEEVARAARWIELVREGKGAHNQAFALELLARAEKELQQVAAAAEGKHIR
jgi:hypothetical protein